MRACKRACACMGAGKTGRRPMVDNRESTLRTGKFRLRFLLSLGVFSKNRGLFMVFTVTIAFSPVKNVNIRPGHQMIRTTWRASQIRARKLVFVK